MPVPRRSETSTNRARPATWKTPADPGARMSCSQATTEDRRLTPSTATPRRPLANTTPAAATSAAVAPATRCR